MHRTQTFRGVAGPVLARLPAMTPHLEALLSHVSGHAGVGRDDAERAALAVMSGIGAYLPEWARRLVAAELPAELGDALIAGRSVALPLEELAIARGTPPHQAHEVVGAVCRVLAEELSDEALVALEAALPADLAQCLRDSPGISPAP